MAGVYIHVPYCKKACTYCDFHFSTSFTTKDLYIESLFLELKAVKHLYEGVVFDTIYFGGGTPSVLTYDEWMRIIEKVQQELHFSVIQEITLEANPDDLSDAKIQEVLKSPINRLSIGVQSFFEEHLIWMNRSHTSVQTHRVLEQLKQHPKLQVSVDLIYGFPLLTEEQWVENLTLATQRYQVPHLSAYYLTPEPKTVLYHQIKKNKQAFDENQGIKDYQQLIVWMKQQGYEHYEISNFCLPGKQAIHNSKYWTQAPYLGLGPSAHSYIRDQRVQNVANNALYIKSLQEQALPSQEHEHLNVAERFNDFLITRLRTKQGISKQELLKFFSEDYWNYLWKGMNHLPEKSKQMIDFNQNSLVMNEGCWVFQDMILKEIVLTKPLI